MDNESEFNRRALLSFGTVAVLSPMLRLFPVQAVRISGRSAWLAGVFASVPMLLYVLFLAAFMSRRRGGENLQELILRALGDKVGKAALLLMSLWLILYAGFVLRSGSDRLVVTVYTSSSPAAFSIVMGAAVLPAVLGCRRTLVRSAQVIRPIVLFSLLLILGFALLSVSGDNLLPVTAEDVLSAWKGSLSGIDVLAVSAYSLCFIIAGAESADGLGRDLMLWVFRLSLLMSLIGLAIVGCFGAELAELLTLPFFVLVRNLVFFRSLERVEALIVMLWIFPDFLLVALFVYTASSCLRLVFGFSPAEKATRLTDMRNGRWLIPLCLTASICISILLAPDAVSMELWSLSLIPGINLAFSFLFLPAVYVVGRLRKSI